MAAVRTLEAFECNCGMIPCLQGSNRWSSVPVYFNLHIVMVLGEKRVLFKKFSCTCLGNATILIRKVWTTIRIGGGWQGTHDHQAANSRLSWLSRSHSIHRAVEWFLLRKWWMKSRRQGHDIAVVMIGNKTCDHDQDRNSYLLPNTTNRKEDSA